MGAGFGVMLIGSLVVIARWFPPDRFSTLSSLVLSIGLIGNLLATTPLAWAADAVGWRGVFGGIVVFTTLAAIAVWLIVRDAPQGHPFLVRKTESPTEMLRGLVQVLRSPGLVLILTLNFCNYACTFTIQGLWGGPFLREAHGLTNIQSGNVLHGRATFPDRLIGRGMATINTSVMLGVACMQTLSGVILGAFGPLANGARTEQAYRSLFGFMCVVLIVSGSIYSRSAAVRRSADVRPRDELRARAA